MAELNDRDEGGLFSDDYEIPKRENPYKKKKPTPEESADPPRKVKKKKAEDKQEVSSPMDKVEDRPAPPLNESFLTEDEEGIHMPARDRSFKESWDGFIFNHVKLICFICGVIIFLLFVSAPAIYYGVQDAREQAEQNAKDPLTLNYVKGLADKSSPITWSDLVSFPYDETDASDSVTWMLKIQGTSYEVWISGTSTQTLPTYVHLYDMRTGDMVDLEKGLAEVERFLAERE